MNRFKKTITLSLLLTLSACTVFLGNPDKRVGKFSDFDLCMELADKTFKYHAAWAWAISDEIKKRELQSSEKCKNIYTTRMNRLMRKVGASPLSFEDALVGRPRT